MEKGGMRVLKYADKEFEAENEAIEVGEGIRERAVTGLW